MSSDAVSDREKVLAAFDAIDAGFDTLMSSSAEAFSYSERLALQHRMETNLRRAPVIEHRMIATLIAEADPKALGGTNLADVLVTRLRISKDEAKRRIKDAKLLGPRRALSGEPLEPVLARTAAAQQRGEIGAEHVTVIKKFFNELPATVDAVTRSQAEADLARIACGLGPTELRQAAERLALLLDQDGHPPSDAERARRRYFTIGRQGPDGMSEFHGRLDPEGRATLDAVFAKSAAPGMCNPDDDTPCIDGKASPEQQRSDTRTPGQRNHDALTAMGRSILASGQLGQHNGLPATIVVSTTLQELESGAGFATTGGGTLLPMSTVIRLASHAHHYLVVFDKHTKVPLYLGRSRRIASPGQRLVLYAKDRGCTRPGCTVPAYWTQAHHAQCDWADGGTTDITTMTLACGPDNRLVEEGGWSTRIRTDGTTEWIPPPHLDTGQTRTNDYHHPDRYLRPEDDP